MSKKKPIPKKNVMGDLMQVTKAEPATKPAKPATKSDPTKAAAYRIGEDTANRVTETAKKYNVKKGELVKFLLNHALDLLDDGQLKIEYAESDKPKSIKM